MGQVYLRYDRASGRYYDVDNPVNGIDQCPIRPLRLPEAEPAWQSMEEAFAAADGDGADMRSDDSDGSIDPQDLPLPAEAGAAEGGEGHEPVGEAASEVEETADFQQRLDDEFERGGMV